jgi:hypothetical protein
MVQDGQFASCWKNLAECKPHSLSFVPSHPVRLGSIEIIACAPHRVGWDHPNVAGLRTGATSLQEYHTWLSRYV